MKCSVSAWFDAERVRIADYNGAGEKFISYNTYNKYYLSWRSNVHTPAEGVRPCPICKFKPRIVAVDGANACVSELTFFSVAAKILKIDADLYHGTPVTFCEGNPFDVESEYRRLDRCFIDSAGHGAKADRGFLRVLAGVRHMAGDPRVLDVEDYESCLKACHQDTRSSAELVDVFHIGCVQALC